MRVSQHRVSQYRGHSSRRNGNSSNNTGWRETASANRDNSLRGKTRSETERTGNSHVQGKQSI